MAFRFRRRIKIAPGLNINLGKRGASLSIGGRGATLNIGKKGVRSTVGIPGTGISYTSKVGGGNAKAYSAATDHGDTTYHKDFVGDLGRKVSFGLALGIFFVPYIFSWFTLRAGYSSAARLVAFGWLLLLLVLVYGV
jgi:hypothetical protein